MFKRKKPYRRFLVISALVLLICGLFFLIDRRVRPTLFSIAEIEVTQMAVDAISNTVKTEVSNNNLKYQDLITVHRDYNGRVAFMQANTVQINQLAADITLDVQRRLQELKGKRVIIPMGQIFGSYLFANVGPYINITINPMGTVKVDVVDKFEQAGINQTRHKIYFSFSTMVRVVIPLYSGEVSIVTDVPIAESIIVGDVPEAVINLQGGILGESINNK